MNNKKLTLYALKQVKIDLENKVLNNFITNISLISNNDIILSFSHFRREKLYISLNNNDPFISCIETNESFPTIQNKLNEFLRKEIKESKLQSIDLINNDKILDMTFSYLSDAYENITRHLIVELIPHKTNLLILNEQRKILFALHYTTLESDRIIVQKAPYEAPKSNLIEKVDEEFSLKSHKNRAEQLLTNAKKHRLKDKFATLINYVNSKIKGLKRKIILLNKDIEEATDRLANKDYGNIALSCIYSDELLIEYLSQEALKDYDRTMSPSENANRYFKIYKKAKSTIEHAKNEILLATEDLSYYENIKSQIEIGDDEDLYEIQSLLLPSKKKDYNHHVKSGTPHFIIVNNIKICFGKTDNQNDILTFKKSKPNYHFLHIENVPGAHVVVFNENPDNEILLIASEICLILSNKKAGDVSHALIKNLKKGSKIGQVIFRHHESFHINDIRKSTIKLLEGSSRLN